jgi:hypothetical protein
MAHILNDSSDEETTDWMFEGVDYIRKGDEVVNTDYELIGTVINGKIDFVNDDARDYHLGEKDESDEELDDTLELPDPELKPTYEELEALLREAQSLGHAAATQADKRAELIGDYEKLLKQPEYVENPRDLLVAELREMSRDLQTKLNALQDAHDTLQAKHDEVVEKHKEQVMNLRFGHIREKVGYIEDKPKPKKVKKKVATRKKVALDPDDYDDTHEYRKAVIMNLSIKAGKSLCKGIDDLNWVGVGNHPDGARQGLRERIWKYYEANVSGMDGQNQRWADDFEEHC